MLQRRFRLRPKRQSLKESRKNIALANSYIRNPQITEERYKESDCILFYSEQQLKNFIK